MNNISEKPIRKGKIAIRTQIINTVFLVLILVLVAIIIISIISDISRDTSRNMAQSYSNEIAEKVNSYILNDLSLVVKVSHSTAISEWLAEEGNQKKKDAAYYELSDIFRAFPNACLYISVRESLNGYKIYDSRMLSKDMVPSEKIDPSMPEGNWFFNIMDNKFDYLLDCTLEEESAYSSDQIWRLWTDHKVMNDGNIIGTFSSGLPVKDLMDSLAKDYEKDKVKTYIVGKNGDVLMSDLFADLNGENTVNHINKISTDPALAKAVDTHRSEIIQVSKKFIAVSPIKNSEWSIIAMYSIESPFSKLNSMNIAPLLVILILSLVLYALINTAVIQLFVFRPIRLFTKSMSDPDSSEENIYGLHRGDEIGELARSANNAITMVKDSSEQIAILLDATPYTCFIWDKNLNILGCNEESTKLFGLSDKQEFKDNYYKFSPEYQPDGQRSVEKAMCVMEKAFEDGRCIFEWLHQKLDGTLIPAEVTVVPVIYNGEQAAAAYIRDMREHKQMMDELKRANEYTALMLDAVPVGANLWDKDYNLFDCNEESAKMFQMKNKQEYISRFYELNPEYQPDGQLSAERVVSLLDKAIDEGKCVFEWMMQLTDGTPVPTEVTCVRIPYENDFIVASYVRDLCEHKEMMNEIKKRDQLLSAANEAAAKLLTTEDETSIDATLIDCLALVGNTLEVDRVQIWRNEVIDGSLHFVHTYEWLSDLGKQKTPVPIGLKFPYSSKPKWENMFLRGEYINGPLSKMPIEDQEFLNAYDMKTIVIIPLFLQGQFWGIFSIDDCEREYVFTEKEIDILHSISLMMINVISRNSQAIKIRETNERSELLLNSMPFACRLLDRDYNVIYYNDESLRLFNLKKGQEYVDRYSELSPTYQPDGSLSVEKSLIMLNKAFEEGKCTFEWLNQTLDGMLVPTEITLVRVPYENDFIVAGYTRDLREYKKMMRNIKETSSKLEEALKDAENANNAKSNFLANISHEMRTPLNAVIGLSELSLGKEELDEETLMNLEKINNAGTTLLNTVNDILDISKIEAGKFELLPIEYDTPSLINDSVTFNVMRIGEKPIKLILDINGDLPARLYGDDLRIKQLFNNLLSNAIKYTREGTVTLSISHYRDGDDIWLTASVRDTGIGIKPQNLKKLFAEYNQVDTTANRKIEGTGLGLAITKKMTEMMDGTISVESEYGKGSIFTVKLRQKYVDDAVIGSVTAENLKNFHYTDQKRYVNFKKERIKLPYARVLVVDDNMTNLDVAKGILKPYGMQIDCVTNGQMAINAINDKMVTYTAIFMDHMMPEMDGIEATQHIREIGTDYAKNIPIIALTANAIVGNEQMFLSKGFNAFLSKPIDISRLDEVIRYWVRDKSKEKDHVAEDILADNEPERINLLNGREIDGLDMQKGLSHFGGDMDIYLEILRSFAINTRPLLEQIRTVNKNNLNDYAIAIHGIKGSGRGVGVSHPSDLAEKLEHASKTGNLDFVNEYNDNFLVSVEKLLSDLEALFLELDADNPKPKKDKIDNGTLKKLVEACENYNMDSVDEVMKELEGYQYESDNELTAWIIENVKMMNFKEIIEKLGGE